MKGLQIGSYQIERVLGEGGMGVVYVGVDVRLGRRAAIKQLLPELCGRRDVIERFFNEARAAANINHPGIVEIYELGWHTDGSAYFAMKLLDGDSLAKRLRGGPFGLATACAIARQIASALSAAHAVGIVHRDLKPDNIILVRDDEAALGERATLLDFGIAKLTGDWRISHRTTAASVMGTPAYMSPEQCRGAGEVDHRTDVYSIGCLFFEMLTGRPPFLGAGAGEVLGLHQFVAPPKVHSLRPDVPTEVDAVVMRCLAKSVDQRYQTMDELIAVLQQCSAGVGSERPAVRAASSGIFASGGALSLVGTSSVPPMPSTITGSRGEVVSKPSGGRRRGLAFAWIASVAVMVCIAIAVVVARSGSSGGRGAKVAESLEATSPEVVPTVVSPKSGHAVAGSGGWLQSANIDASQAQQSDAASAKMNNDEAKACLELEAKQKWEELHDCARELAVRATATNDEAIRDRAEEFRQKAVREAAAAVVTDKFQVALRDGNLREGQKQLRAIGVDSVYHAASGEAFRAAEARAIEDNLRKAAQYALAHDCSALKRLQKQLATSSIPAVAGAVAAVKCSDKPTATAASGEDSSQPQAAVASTSGLVGQAAARSPCDTTNVADFVKDAQKQFTAGLAQAALDLIIQGLACNQDVRMYRFAVTYACAARNTAAAKLYFGKVPPAFQPPLVQKCQLENITLP